MTEDEKINRKQLKQIGILVVGIWVENHFTYSKIQCKMEGVIRMLV